MLCYFAKTTSISVFMSKLYMSVGVLILELKDMLNAKANIIYFRI